MDGNLDAHICIDIILHADILDASILHVCIDILHVGTWHVGLYTLLNDIRAYNLAYACRQLAWQ